MEKRDHIIEQMMIAMQCFHLQNGRYLVATDCYVTPMLSVDKQIIFNMSSIIIFCLLSKCRTPPVRKLIAVELDSSFSQTSELYEYVYPNEIWCQTLQVEEGLKALNHLHIDYWMFFNLHRGWPFLHTGSGAGGGGGWVVCRGSGAPVNVPSQMHVLGRLHI